MKKKNSTMKTAAMVGLMVGTAAGLMTSGMVKSKKRKIAKTAGKALDTVGEAMQSLSAHLK